MIRSWFAKRKQARVERWARETKVVEYFNSPGFDKELIPAVMEWLKDGGDWPVPTRPAHLRGRRR